MGTNFKQFSQEMDDLKNKIKDEIEVVIKDVVSEIFKALLEPAPLGTPKDTGFLKSNWIISVDIPRPFPVGSKINVSSAISEQKRSFTGFLNRSLDGTKMIFINNGVNYGSIVNYGSSSRPPTNFVERSTQRGARRLNKSRVIK